MMFGSNYHKPFAGVGDDCKAGVANDLNIISKHDSKLKKTGRIKRRSTTQKWVKGFQNAFQNGADIWKQAIQKLIDKWIPICIALGDDAKTTPK